MIATQHGFPGQPVWQQQVRSRLAVCMALSISLLGSVLLLPRSPELPTDVSPEITVQLVADEASPEPAAEFTPIEELPVPAARTVELFDLVPENALPSEAPPIDQPPRDWTAQIRNAARDVVDASESGTVMQPAQLEARRRAAIQFAPSRAPVRKPIWENVEIDHIGRKILVSGDCYRVLEDWRVTYQDIQREFGQYMVHCSGIKRYPIGVDWVGDVAEKFAYVRYPDGDIPPQELAQLTRSY